MHGLYLPFALASRSQPINRSALLPLIAYSTWANLRLFAVAGRVDEALLHADSPFFDHGTAFRTFVHIVDVEWSWYRCARGVDMRPHLADVEPVADLTALRAYAVRFGAELAAYVRALSEEELVEAVDIGTATGKQPEFTQRVNILVHLANHGTQHRGELGHFLTSLGHSPGEIDYMDHVQGIAPALSD